MKQLDWRKKYGGTMEGLAATGARTGGPSTSRTLELKELIQRKERGPLSPSTSALPSPGMLPSSPNPVALQSPSPFLAVPDLVLPSTPSVPPTITEDQEGPQDDADDPVTASGPAPQPVAPAEEPPTDDGSASSTASLVASTPTPPAPLRSASTAEREGATTPQEPQKRILSGGLLADIAAGSPLKSALGVGGGGGTRMSVDLLSSISQGKALKAAAAEEGEGSGVQTPVSKAKMTMLSEIKMNKTKLKHIDNNDKGVATPSSIKAAPAPTLGASLEPHLTDVCWMWKASRITLHDPFCITTMFWQLRRSRISWHGGSSFRLKATRTKIATRKHGRTKA